MQMTRMNEQESTIRTFKAQFKAYEDEKKQLVEEKATLSAENNKIRPALDDLQKRHKLTEEKCSELEMNIVKSEALLFQSNIARKQLHNDLLDLKGNIRVFCRVRPSLDMEKGRALCGWQYMDETSLEISLVDGSKKLQKHDFSFDQVFHPQSTQQEVFELVSLLIQSAFDGYNVCIFAYGQTGSGKTFTMEGTPAKTGIIPRTVDLLFSSVENYKLMGWSYNISVSFLEIYNEVLSDLLCNEQKELEIRMVNPKTPHEIYVSNLTTFTVESANDLRELIEVANSHRATAATVGNERSSRSHAVTQIQLTGTHAGRGKIYNFYSYYSVGTTPTSLSSIFENLLDSHRSLVIVACKNCWKKNSDQSFDKYARRKSVACSD